MKAKAKQKGKELHEALDIPTVEMVAIEHFVRDVELSCDCSVSKILRKIAAKYAPRQKLNSALLYALYIAGFEQALRSQVNELLKLHPQFKCECK